MATSILDSLRTLGEKRINSVHTSERSCPFLLTTLWHLWLPFLCACLCVPLHQSHKTSFFIPCLTYWYHPTTDKTQSSVIWADVGIICNAQKSLVMFKTRTILNTLLSLTGILITPMPCRCRIWKWYLVFPNRVYAIQFRSVFECVSVWACVCPSPFVSLSLQNPQSLV